MSNHLKIKHKDIIINFLNNIYTGYLVTPTNQCPRPLVIIIHNFQGLKFFEKNVAEYLARLGYVGLAIDLYGNMVLPHERLWPKETNKIQKFQKNCFEALVSLDHDHKKLRTLLEIWISNGLQQTCVDKSFPPVVIGYCFGGMAALECVRGGMDVGGVVGEICVWLVLR